MKKIKKWNVTLDVFLMETIYEVEAITKEEAIEKAKDQSRYRGEAELKVFEVEET